MFVNFSNHKSALWSEKQRLAAEAYGEIVDVPFPMVSSVATEDEIDALADQCVEEIVSKNPDAAMCQGEFTLTYAVINKLLAKGIKCVSACSDRVVVERQMSDGTTQKQSVFEFVQFRQYR